MTTDLPQDTAPSSPGCLQALFHFFLGLLIPLAIWVVFITMLIGNTIINSKLPAALTYGFPMAAIAALLVIGIRLLRRSKYNLFGLGMVVGAALVLVIGGSCLFTISQG
jgi:hypothetical protein